MNDFIDIAYSVSGEDQVEKGRLSLESHYHNAFEIIYIVEGEAIFKINDKEYKASADNLIFINNLENHHVEATIFPYRRYFILIDPAWFQSTINDPILASIFKNRPSHFNHSVCLNEDLQKNVDQLFRSLLIEYTNKPDYWELALKSYIQKLFVLLYRYCKDAFPVTSYNSSIELASNVQRYIEEHCTEEISLKKVSQLFYVDMYYLSHLFKDSTGFSFKEYLILQRISRAKDLLFYTNDSITEVCTKSGFNNANHFIRIFKRYTGLTPLKYRTTGRQC
ncbi:MAG: AraC family transcriptional regulator [Clostridiaceae bacterium]|jgi:AraC-like DNA-binding protein|nr:AraC family transcriptional regulator [Clostridiaceae bacterium]